MKQRLTRKKWLELALEVLVKEGNAELRINHLVKCLGVTKGSFYWHFKDRDDFIISLVDHWAKVSTLMVVEQVKKVQGSAEERLFELMRFIVINNLIRYENAVRAWALMEIQVASIVKKTDKRRFDFIRDLFSEMGVEGKELEMRALTLVTFYAMEHGQVMEKPTEKERLDLMQLHHAMLTRPVSKD